MSQNESPLGRDFVLTVRRGGKLLAQWSLDQGPLELSVTDQRTGHVTATFMATPPVDEGEVQYDGREQEDDITLPLPESSAALALVERQPEASDHVAVGAAEVWIRKAGEWRAAGDLGVMQRVTTLGGSVRLGQDGRLVVSAGPRLNGSATLPDGRTVEIARGSEGITLPAGSSVLLGDGEHGLYVRSDLSGLAATQPNVHQTSGLNTLKTI